MQTIRISLPAIDALEANPDPRDYSLLADEDNILIKEHSRGSGNLVSGQATINHGLGYIPFYLVYGEVSSGVFQLIGYYTLHHAWKVYADVDNLVILGSGTDAFKYYIFYDDMS